MISVPAMRLHQFGVFLYQAILSARDVDKLVRFEVLSYDGGGPPPPPKGKRGKPKPSRVNWELLERRIGESSEAYQRPVIRKKIAELVEYYVQCADTGNLPAVPGAVLLVSDRRLEFTATSSRSPSSCCQQNATNASHEKFPSQAATQSSSCQRPLRTTARSRTPSSRP